MYGQAVQKGHASYYSNRLHGRRMSNGDRYHRDSMTCAHLKYPLGTLLKVKNPKNGKEVVVEVTDRGPHTRRFVIDLSYAAARELDIIRSGFSIVEITPWHEDEVPYRSEKTEYDLSQPEFSAQRPLRTWNHPEWEKRKETGEETPVEEAEPQGKADGKTVDGGSKPGQTGDKPGKSAESQGKPAAKSGTAASKSPARPTGQAGQPSDGSQQ